MISRLFKLVLLVVFFISPLFAKYLHAAPLTHNALFSELALKHSDISEDKITRFYQKWKGVKYK